MDIVVSLCTCRYLYDSCFVFCWRWPRNSYTYFKPVVLNTCPLLKPQGAQNANLQSNTSPLFAILVLPQSWKTMMSLQSVDDVAQAGPIWAVWDCYTPLPHPLACLRHQPLAKYQAGLTPSHTILQSDHSYNLPAKPSRVSCVEVNASPCLNQHAIHGDKSSCIVNGV